MLRELHNARLARQQQQNKNATPTSTAAIDTRTAATTGNTLYSSNSKNRKKKKRGKKKTERTKTTANAKTTQKIKNTNTKNNKSELKTEADDMAFLDATIASNEKESTKRKKPKVWLREEVKRWKNAAPAGTRTMGVRERQETAKKLQNSIQKRTGERKKKSKKS